MASTAPRLRPVPAVTRSIAILRLLGRSVEPLGVKAIADALELVPSTALHILRVLVAEDLVKVDPVTKRYALGVGMLPLARSVIERNGFAAVVQPVLDRISARWGVTAIGVQVSGLQHMIVLALARSHGAFSLHVDVGSRFPALISATGRLVAAFGGHPWAEVEKTFRKLRWQNAPSLEAWKREVEAVKKKGFSVDRGNYIGGVTVVAVPVIDPHGHVVHALVGAGVADQLDNGRAVALAADMRTQAERIGEQLFGARSE